MPDWRKKLKRIINGKKICLVGFGREGQSTLKVLKSINPKIEIALTDSKVDPDYLKDLKKYDLIVRSPGIPLKLVKQHISPEAQITSQTKLFFKFCPAKVIGVTGTKGKSSTASLIASVLKQEFKVSLVGNIGRPPLDYLDKLTAKSVAVFEISSHQLSDLEQSPPIAVILNLFPEHLDYYHDFGEYAAAKEKITKFQTKNDLLIYNSADKKIAKIAAKSRAKKISFAIDGHSSADCFADKDFIYWRKLPVFPIKKSPLSGRFNLLNLMPAIILGKYFGIKDDLIIKAISAFKPLPHRLELVGKFKGIRFVNDSLATIPEAAINAIKTFEDSLGTLIVGGYDRGVDQTDLAQAIIDAEIPTIIVFPNTGDGIAAYVRKHKGGITKIFRAENMRQAVSWAKKHTAIGKICLMSPGAASFNMFRDYQDRGEQFKAAVKKL